ncbi:MAG TPA: hypothetical protein VM658_16950 [bacterium]|nr:hypothetical protein [bacterium]
MNENQEISPFHGGDQQRHEWIIILVLFLLSFISLLLRLKLATFPFEDAAMLMRYAKHLAEGHGIVWNIGEGPVDGATDFGFMVIIAGLVRLGLDMERAAILPGMLGHFVIIILLYFVPRRLFNSNPWLCLFPSLWIAFGPGIFYSSAYFGTSLFAASALIAWTLAYLYMERGGFGAAAAFAFASLACGLIRPEGVILCTLFLISILVRMGIKQSKPALFWFTAVFAVLGGAYFLWRWRYFGHPLPNPYYKKGGGELHLNGLIASLTGVFTLSWPFLAWTVSWFFPLKRTREGLANLIPVAGFTLVWVLMSQEMNTEYRFQYPVIPVFLLAWPRAAGLVMDRLFARPWLGSPLRRRAAVALIFVAAFICLDVQYVMNERWRDGREGRVEVAKALAAYRDKKYSMAVTAAGNLPLYSDWIAIDAWGLNDAYIAHHGMITDDYMDQYKPELIMFNAPWRPNEPFSEDTPWRKMGAVLHGYAEKKGYVLAAVWSLDGQSCHWYYVRPGFEDSDAIIGIIRSIDYRWGMHGRKAKRFFPPRD